MSKELLLNIATHSVSASASKQTPAGDNSENTGFSLALDEQITAQSATTGSALPSTDLQVNSNDKAENIAVESGNNSPVSVDITTQWLQQLLPTADQTAIDDLAEQLTDFIAPLIKQITAGELSDHEAAIQIEQWMQQLANLQQVDATQSMSETSELMHFDGLIEQFKALDLPPEVTEKLAQFFHTVTAQSSETIVQRSNTATEKTAEQQNGKPIPAVSVSSQAVIEQKQRPEPNTATEGKQVTSTLLHKAPTESASPVVANDKSVNANTVSEDKVARIDNLVKQIVPAQLTETTVGKGMTERLDNQTSERSQRVAELVQSLTRQGDKEAVIVKPDAVATTQNKMTPIEHDTKLARIAQLVAALSPSLKEETTTSSVVDKASPVTTAATASVLPTAATSAVAMKVSPTLDIQPALQNEAWNRVLTSRVIWLAKEGIQQASLKLNPAHLGPVEVRMAMHHEQTHVTFVAAQAATRDALEQALPRLRESFVENGLELGNATVSEQTSQQANDQRDSDDNTNGFHERSSTTQAEQQVNDHAAGSEQNIELGVNVYA